MAVVVDVASVSVGVKVLTAGFVISVALATSVVVVTAAALVDEVAALLDNSATDVAVQDFAQL